MSGRRAFFDTDVLFYMYGSDIAKQHAAKAIFGSCSSTGRMLLSTQVVQEFYAAGLRKVGIPRPKLKEMISGLLDLPLVIVDPSHITGAIENEERYQISFWDGLILAAAAAGGAEILYTEDLNHGQRYGAVLVQNPFVTQTT